MEAFKTVRERDADIITSTKHRQRETAQRCFSCLRCEEDGGVVAGTVMIEIVNGLVNKLQNVIFSNNTHEWHVFKLRCTSFPAPGFKVGVDRLSAWPIIGADIKHFYDYRYRPFQNRFAANLKKNI